jgi:hypothetical protein
MNATSLIPLLEILILTFVTALAIFELRFIGRYIQIDSLIKSGRPPVLMHHLRPPPIR